MPAFAGTSQLLANALVAKMQGLGVADPTNPHVLLFYQGLAEVICLHIDTNLTIKIDTLATTTVGQVTPGVIVTAGPPGAPVGPVVPIPGGTTGQGTLIPGSGLGTVI